MSEKTPFILPEGCQVVVLRPVSGQGGRTVHPRGAVGIVVKSPSDRSHSYRIRFPDGMEEPVRADEVIALAHYKNSVLRGESLSENPGQLPENDPLFSRVILRCVIGSRAYGLEDDDSDTDYRGVFLPTAEDHWSLYGVPEVIECYDTQEHYWELQRFLVLALKSNPNVLECLYTPLIEKSSPVGEQLLQMKDAFLSRLVYQTYNGYVMSQFKKMQADLRNQGQVKPKHVMHLIRLLMAGIHILRHGFVPVRVESHRDQLLAIRRGEISLDETEAWRLSLHKEFDQALEETSLPERPDYERVNEFLISARRSAIQV
jgi:predicted nucleotidyltransferase